MKVKELITKLLELRDMELEVIVCDNYCDYDIEDVNTICGAAAIHIKRFEKAED